jgi:hypothetical protein
VRRVTPPCGLHRRRTILASVPATLYFSTTWIFGTYDPPKGTHEFGETFGFANALFSGIALILIAAAFLLQAFENRRQNDLYRAQLIRDRYELYWRLYEPVTDDHLKTLRAYPEGYMSRDTYESKYKGDGAAKDELIRRYIILSATYEYLAFSVELYSQVKDPIKGDWIGIWVLELWECPEFQDVHRHYESYYETFADYLKRLLSKKLIPPASIPLPPPSKGASPNPDPPRPDPPTSP